MHAPGLPPGLRLAPFDLHTEDEAVLHSRTHFSNRMQVEVWPEDPPDSMEQVRRRLRGAPAFEQRGDWAVWDGGTVVGLGLLLVSQTPDNRHAAGFHVGVLPEGRGRGIGRALLAPVVDGARAAERTLLIVASRGSVPAGAAFLERMGARPGLESHVNELRVEEVDRGLLALWQQRARERAQGFELGWWGLPYPEESIPEVVAMKEAVNLMPRGELEVEDEHFTPEMVRETDAAQLRRGGVRWTLFARETASGRIAGYTEVHWNPNNPHVAWQSDTAVFREFQNRGLGRWLKAVMLERILAERPQVTRIRTGNADSNAPMLAINRELGFRPVQSTRVWQVETDRAAAYLAASGPGG